MPVSRQVQLVARRFAQAGLGLELRRFLGGNGLEQGRGAFEKLWDISLFVHVGLLSEWAAYLANMFQMITPARPASTRLITNT